MRSWPACGPDECIAVIIDEAQDLSDDALEDLRLLSNFQSLERRRLQIVLVGQIDLARRLAGPQLRQLNQRIGARALLPILQGREIYDYVDYRLRSRGGEIERLFARGAMGELMRSSGGIPRRINVLCHNALLLAYADGEHSVTRQSCASGGPRLRPPAGEQSIGAREDGGIGQRRDAIGEQLDAIGGDEICAGGDACSLEQADDSLCGGGSFRSAMPAGNPGRRICQAALRCWLSDSHRKIGDRSRKFWPSGRRRHSKPSRIRKRCRRQRSSPRRSTFMTVPPEARTK